eukprot:11159313-Lingulodinium_polyedra.AAC.1
MEIAKGGSGNALARQITRQGGVRATRVCRSEAGRFEAAGPPGSSDDLVGRRAGVIEAHMLVVRSDASNGHAHRR